MVKEKKKESVAAEKLIAVVRIRGDIGVNRKISDTLKLLRLHKKNRCVVIKASENYMGMVNKAKDYCTYGEIDEETFVELLTKRGRIVGDKPLTEDFLKSSKLDVKTLAKKMFDGDLKMTDVEGLKPFFKLHPPVGGFEREGIKKPYAMHGALGYRGANINKLIRRMI